MALVFAISFVTFHFHCFCPFLFDFIFFKVMWADLRKFFCKKRFEMCFWLWRSVVVLTWPFVVGRTLKSSYCHSHQLLYLCLLHLQCVTVVNPGPHPYYIPGLQGESRDDVCSGLSTNSQPTDNSVQTDDVFGFTILFAKHYSVHHWPLFPEISPGTGRRCQVNMHAYNY